MKPTPTKTTAIEGTHEITRETAAYMLRRERGEGIAMRFHHLQTLSPYKAGYILTGQNAFIVVPMIPRPPVIPTPEPFSLSVRLSHKYVTGWSNLDRWKQIGTALPIPTSRPAKWDEDGESFSSIELLQVDCGDIRPDNVKRAIMDTMKHGCRCEHDCCGHVQTYVSRVRKIGPKLYAAKISGYRNV